MVELEKESKVIDCPKNKKYPNGQIIKVLKLETGQLGCPEINNCKNPCVATLEKMPYVVKECEQGRRYFRDGKWGEIIEVASFDDGETGCPLAGIGECGNLCTAFNFKIPEKVA
jgi:hypothetical protein